MTCRIDAKPAKLLFFFTEYLPYLLRSEYCQDLFLCLAGTLPGTQNNLYLFQSFPSFWYLACQSKCFSGKAFHRISRHIPQIADTEAPSTCLFSAFPCLPFFPFLLDRLLL